MNQKIFIKNIKDIKFLKYKEVMNNIINANSDYKNLKNSDAILFGAAEIGKRFLNLLNGNVKVVAFCDNNSNLWGGEINGVKIISPDELLNNYHKNMNIIITIESFTEIQKQLEIMGFINVFSYLFLTIIDSGKYEVPHSSNMIKSFFKNRGKIEKLYNNLEDQRSKEVLFTILSCRLNLDYSQLAGICEKNQYFDEGIIKIKTGEIFIDGGAYIGDTIESFIGQHNGMISKIYAFEPDVNNYRKLCMELKNKYNIKIITIRKGLFSCTKKVNYIFKGIDSRISINGTRQIYVVSMDDYFNNKRVSFIKLDIEGAEQDALIGAKNIIEEQMPKIAVCVYHKPNDLWEIPLLIKSINKKYKIYLRHYSTQLYETDCYAVVH